jgi:xanthine dehydrogenase YagT iron-sulfur-binding subunit
MSLNAELDALIGQTDVRMHVSMTVNGSLRTISVEPRTTLLDVLRDELALTGPKKSCESQPMRGTLISPS